MKQIFTLLFLSASMFLGAQNILQNGSFESWSEGLPDFWFGSKSNIAQSKVLESSDAQDGSKSVELINNSSSHKRFTSEGYNLTAGTTYTLTFYAKGSGEVRNSFFNGNPDSSGGGYASYSPYTTVDGNWQKITYVFDTDVDVTGVEIIFSVRNTAEEDGVLIDNANLTEGGEVEVTEVATIADLRAGVIGGPVYKLTGEALLTYKISNRHQKYIQDNTAGILIDDVAARLGDDYEVGDKIKNITGSLVDYNGLIQFVPTEAGEAAVSSGNPVNYQLVSLSAYLANPTAYESEYIAINDVTISDFEGGDGTFQNGKGYPVTDGTYDVEARTQIYDIPIIGQPIPSSSVAIFGFGGRFNATIQVFLTDVTDAMGVSDLTDSDVVMTTVWTNTANFVTEGKAAVEIFNMNGQLIQKAEGNNAFQLNVSGLAKGVYVVKVTADGKTTIRKAVKK